MTLFYGEDGDDEEDFLLVPDAMSRNYQPVAYSFIADSGLRTIRFFRVDSQYTEVILKAHVYVLEESFAVEKIFTFAAIPNLANPQAFVYDEAELAYGWKNFGGETLFVGQENKLKAHDYNVTVNGQPLTLDSNGVEIFTPIDDGEYTVSAVLPYDSSVSYTAKLFVKQAKDVYGMLLGSYARNGYTVTFGGSNSVTVQNDGESDVALTYNYSDGVFATVGSETISVVLTPKYKLYLIDGDEKIELSKVGAVANAAVKEILGGTSWTKVVVEPGTTKFKIIVSVTFNSDDTGTIIKIKQLYLSGVVRKTAETNFTFNYSAESVGEKYKLIFDYIEYIKNEAGIFEFGEWRNCLFNYE